MSYRRALILALAIGLAGCGRSGGGDAPAAAAGSTGGSSGGGPVLFPSWSYLGSNDHVTASGPVGGGAFDLSITGSSNMIECPAGSEIRNISITGSTNEIVIHGTITGSVYCTGSNNDILVPYPQPLPTVSGTGSGNSAGWYRVN